MTDIVGIETILEYIRTTSLPRINGEGSYNFTPALISRNFQMPQNVGITNMPAIFIVDTGWVDITAETGCEYTTGNNITGIDNGYFVSLFGVVNIADCFDDSGKLSEEMNKLHSDMIIAMHNDTSGATATADDNLGGLVDAMVLTKRFNSLEYIDEKIGIALQIYSLKFQFTPYL